MTKHTLHKYAGNRWTVRDSKDKLTGVVEKHEFMSYPHGFDGKAVPMCFWLAKAQSSGFRRTAHAKFKTRVEAVRFLLKESNVHYADRRMSWKKRQGESAKLKEAKRKAA